MVVQLLGGTTVSQDLKVLPEQASHAIVDSRNQIVPGVPNPQIFLAGLVIQEFLQIVRCATNFSLSYFGSDSPRGTHKMLNLRQPAGDLVDVLT